METTDCGDSMISRDAMIVSTYVERMDNILCNNSFNDILRGNDHVVNVVIVPLPVQRHCIL